MKMYTAKEMETVLVGRTNEIKAIYKSIVRAWKKEKTDVYPLFSDTPVFSESKQIYGLRFENETVMTVVNSDTIMAMIIGGQIYENL